MSNKILCELCNQDYLVTSNTYLICPNPKCNFCETSPLTYENDINAYDAEDKVMNRFS